MREGERGREREREGERGREREREGERQREKERWPGLVAEILDLRLLLHQLTDKRVQTNRQPTRQRLD